MSFTLGSRRGIVSEVNVVPLIDILLVLPVIIHDLPRQRMGLRAVLPQTSSVDTGPLPETIIDSLALDG